MVRLRLDSGERVAGRPGHASSSISALERRPDSGAKRNNGSIAPWFLDVPGAVWCAHIPLVGLGEVRPAMTVWFRSGLTTRLGPQTANAETLRGSVLAEGFQPVR